MHNNRKFGLNLKKFPYILVLCIAFAIACIILISVQVHFLRLNRKLDYELNNQKAKEAIGFYIREQIIHIKANFYRFALPNNLYQQRLIYRDTIKRLKLIQDAFYVLENGGVINDHLLLNILGKSGSIHKIKYIPTGNNKYILEIIELKPKIQDLKKRIDKLNQMLSAIYHSADSSNSFKYNGKEKSFDDNKNFNFRSEVNDFFIFLAPIFVRIEEEINRLLYTSDKELKKIEKEILLKRQENIFLQISILFITFTVVTFLSIIIARILMKAKDKAEAGSRAKSEFLANMSHEIRTPLNSVIGFTELLENSALSNEQKHYVKNANSSGHILLGIINNILDFSKIEAGMMELEYIKCNLSEIIYESVDLIIYNAQNKGLEVIVDIKHNVPEFIVIDSTRLSQVIANLLSNALKFTDNGEISLIVSFDKIDNEKGIFKFSVSDTGIGIKQQNIKKLFNAFSQADGSTTRKFGGTGLGLTISKMIIDKFEGEINIHSEIGKGTTIAFEIPGSYEYDFEESKNNLPEVISNCLVIGGSKQGNFVVEQVLQNNNITCTTVIDDNIALLKEKLKNNTYQLLIIDKKIGDDSIFEIFKKIKADLRKNFGVIIIHSPNEQTKFYSSCKDHGINNLVVKPVKKELLVKTIKNTFDSNVYMQNFGDGEKVDYNSKTNISKSTYKVLFAEDVKMNLTLGKIMVKRFLPNADFSEASNGAEAVKLFIKAKPDIIFMDLQMPVMDGFDAAKKIREIENSTDNKVPIIALTAGAFEQERKKCSDAGMNDFLTKPLDQKYLKIVLDEYLPKKTEIIYFNYNKLLEMLDSDTETVKELINASQDAMPEMIQSLQLAVKRQDYEQAKINAHKIKGTSFNLCFESLGDQARDIEQIIIDSGDWDIIENKVQTLVLEWKDLVGYLATIKF